MTLRRRLVGLACRLGLRGEHGYGIATTTVTNHLTGVTSTRRHVGCLDADCPNNVDLKAAVYPADTNPPPDQEDP